MRKTIKNELAPGQEYIDEVADDPESRFAAHEWRRELGVRANMDSDEFLAGAKQLIQQLAEQLPDWHISPGEPMYLSQDVVVRSPAGMYHGVWINFHFSPCHYVSVRLPALYKQRLVRIKRPLYWILAAVVVFILCAAVVAIGGDEFKHLKHVALASVVVACIGAIRLFWSVMTAITNKIRLRANMASRAERAQLQAALARLNVARAYKIRKV